MCITIERNVMKIDNGYPRVLTLRNALAPRALKDRIASGRIKGTLRLKFRIAPPKVVETTTPPPAERVLYEEFLKSGLAPA